MVLILPIQIWTLLPALCLHQPNAGYLPDGLSYHKQSDSYLPDLVTYMWDCAHLENSRELTVRTRADCGEPQALCQARCPLHPSQHPQTITKPAFWILNIRVSYFKKKVSFCNLTVCGNLNENALIGSYI